MDAKYILRFYVTNDTPCSHHIIKNLQDILGFALHENYDLKVIDVCKTPQLAEEDKILATPTLVKVSPQPSKRLIGDLFDKEKVLLGLDLPVNG